jgi:hypothetical protein
MADLNETASGPARTDPGDAGRVGPLRGATVDFNGRRVVQVVLGIVIATLAVLVVVFTVGGIHDNDQINRLHSQGRPVTVTVTGCLGLLGGSGSNAAGDSCQGNYQLDGHVYHEPLPGTTLYPPGTRVRALAVPGDPALVSPLAVIDHQRASSGVFVLPAMLLGALVLVVGVIVWRRQRRVTGQSKPAAGPDGP